MAAPSRDELLAAVEPVDAGDRFHERIGWVELLTSDGRIEDQ
nr:hypothetical protein [Mycobacterium leprae]